MERNSSIRTLKGIGEKTEAAFAKAGIYTLQDLLHYYPRGYDVYEDVLPVSELEEGKTAAVTGKICGKVQAGGSRTMKIIRIRLKDASGYLLAVWYQMPYLKNTLKEGMSITLRGKISKKQDQLVMEHPELFIPAENYQKKLDTLQPLYSLTTGLTNNLISKSVRQVLDEGVCEPEILPKSLRKAFALCDLKDAVREIHFPENKETYYRARNRLVFDEFLVFLMALRGIREKKDREENRYTFAPQPLLERFLNSLPYTLTKAQMRVWQEIREDLQGDYIMSRLIQGDVGSGKTIVALLALFYTCLNGYQAAMMAPTEVLAKQHYLLVEKMLEEYQIPIKAVLLTGSVKGKERRRIYEEIESGEAQLIIGTQALIQEKVAYQKLALVVTDEQHRFGVRQRETFAEKGQIPHILVMSATPIPRTLALILYGDLHISVIDELPSNRKPIKNCAVDTGYRQNAYRFMEKQIAAGRQCYVICPLLEESENLEAENVLDYAEKLQQQMGNRIRVGYLHGKMKPEQKEAIMTEFKEHRMDILVSTTVIEVGIDVPNATVMLIENAERFGLSQLHQLRGRVGRGKEQSYCIFMSGTKAKAVKERLSVLEKSNDGFLIAREDLRLRGPGDVFGIRQSGLMDFQIGDIFQDAPLLRQASEAAEQLADPDDALRKTKEWKFFEERVRAYLRKGALEKTI